jgi:peptide-methionine (S)-S-oxide reductase
MSTDSNKTESIVVGGGCFWCIDSAYRRVEGVTEVISGYAGGHTEDPDYYEVASQKSGHAEVVKVTFDPQIITLSDILEIFWILHDPTTKDRQGHDIGPEYRSIILYLNDEQRAVIDASLQEAQKVWDNPIVTEIKPLEKFYEAEAEHQDFYNSGRRPDYCQIVIDPKLAKLRQKFAQRLKKDPA